MTRKRPLRAICVEGPSPTGLYKVRTKNKVYTCRCLCEESVLHSSESVEEDMGIAKEKVEARLMWMNRNPKIIFEEDRDSVYHVSGYSIHQGERIKRELDEDIFKATESTFDEAVKLLEKFNVGEYWESRFEPKNPKSTRGMTFFVEMLKESGLNIGKSDAEFGYRMPLPEKDSPFRSLQVFRRRY